MFHVKHIDWETIKVAIVCLFMLFCVGVVLFTDWFDNIDPKDRRNGTDGTDGL